MNFEFVIRNLRYFVSFLLTLGQTMYVGLSSSPLEVIRLNLKWQSTTLRVSQTTPESRNRGTGKGTNKYTYYRCIHEERT